MDARTRVRDFMLTAFKESGFSDDFKDDQSLIESGVLDSLSILKLISFMDEQYSIMPNEDELKPEIFESINLIVSFIESKIKLN